jgi:hypothetical protein
MDALIAAGRAKRLIVMDEHRVAQSSASPASRRL